MARAERALRLQQITERGYPVSNTPALLWNNLGLKQLESVELPRAFRNFMQAIAEDPTLAVAHNNMGLLYLEIGDLQQAIGHFDLALHLTPEMDVIYSNRGLAFDGSRSIPPGIAGLQQSHNPIQQ